MKANGDWGCQAAKETKSTVKVKNRTLVSDDVWSEYTKDQ